MQFSRKLLLRPTNVIKTNFPIFYALQGCGQAFFDSAHPFCANRKGPKKFVKWPPRVTILSMISPKLIELEANFFFVICSSHSALQKWFEYFFLSTYYFRSYMPKNIFFQKNWKCASFRGCSPRGFCEKNFFCQISLI